jgi:hypothetical protein
MIPQTPMWDKLPGFLFDMMPYKWKDADFLNDLAIYEGPDIRAVRENPGEFVRDDFLMYNHLKAAAGAGPDSAK